MTNQNNSKHTTKKLGIISETMLITVWARAVETERHSPNQALLNDPVAVDIVKQIDYDFSVFESAKMSQIGCCIRSKQIDDMALTFIKKHPDAVVIQLGAGLDSRYQRLNCPDITHWYDLDLKEAIAIREQLCPTHEKNSLLAMSMFETSWIETVKAHNKPVLIIIEGVLMYFEQAKVKEFFDMVCGHFEKTTILMDMLTYVAKGNAKRHDAVKKTKNKAEFKWSLINSKDMEAWNQKIYIAEERYMSDYDQKRFPLLIRKLCKIPYIYKRFNQRMLRIEIN